MAVTEEGSDGSRAPRQKQYAPLKQWDRKNEPPPRAPVGANYRPLLPVPKPEYDQPQLKTLTPYAMPTERDDAVASAKAGGQPYAPTSGYGGIGQERGTLSGTTSRAEAMSQLPKVTRSETLRRPEKEVTRKVVKLSWEEYNRLSEEQRAAVDFNTLLVQAREKDLNADYDASPSQMEHFQEEAERVFGEGRGSETFAPETLGVLKDLDFKSSGTEDLDNFLGLKDAISVKELKNFSFDREVRPPEIENPNRDAVLKAISPGGAGGLGTEQRAGVYTQNLQKAMVNANELLQTWRASAAQHRYGDVLGLGGDPVKPGRARPYEDKPMFKDEDGDGSPDDYPFQSLAQDTLASLANAQMDPGIALNAIGTLDEKDTQSIMRYLDEQTRASLAVGTGVYGLQGKNTRSPVEIRKLLGLDAGGN